MIDDILNWVSATPTSQTDTNLDKILKAFLRYRTIERVGDFVEERVLPDSESKKLQLEGMRLQNERMRRDLGMTSDDYEKWDNDDSSTFLRVLGKHGNNYLHQVTPKIPSGMPEGLKAVFKEATIFNEPPPAPLAAFLGSVRHGSQYTDLGRVGNLARKFVR